MDFAQESPNAAGPPASDEFELSVFGPGVGECLLMHLGNGDWFVVDSCRYPNSRLPVAIDYLETIGIEPSNAIKCILATHWHDDHIRGICDIVRRCPNATFAMSAALNQSQFYQLVLEVEEQNRLVAASSSATEFADILDQLATRNTQPPTGVSDGFLLFDGGFNNRVQVRALSPSPATVRDTQVGIARRIMTGGKTRKLRRLDPNDLSVALQVSTGHRDLLLKADLENCENKLAGWNAVLESRQRPTQPSEIVKVGHHGSKNADNDEVWRSMVADESTSVVTPYSRLPSPLPRDKDIQRIKGRQTALYCTTWPPSTRPPRRQGVDGLATSATRTRRALNRKPGLVRLRFAFTATHGSASVETFGSAKEL